MRTLHLLKDYTCQHLTGYKKGRKNKLTTINIINDLFCLFSEAVTWSFLFEAEKLQQEEPTYLLLCFLLSQSWWWGECFILCGINVQLLAWIQQDNVDAARYGMLQKKTCLQQRRGPKLTPEWPEKCWHCSYLSTTSSILREVCNTRLILAKFIFILEKLRIITDLQTSRGFDNQLGYLAWFLLDTWRTNQQEAFLQQ